MASQPQPLPTTNLPASLADKVVQDILKDLVPLAEAALEVQAPFLTLPVVKQIWEALFGWITGAFIQAGGLVVGYVAIDVEKYNALNKAAQALIDLRGAQKAGFPNGIQDASNAIDQAIAPILHYVGDVRPQ